MYKFVVVPCHNLDLTKCGTPMGFFLCHNLHTKNIGFPNELFVLGFIHQLPKLLFLELFWLEMLKIQSKMIIIVFWYRLNFMRLKFAFSELFINLFNPAQAISTKIKSTILLFFLAPCFWSINSSWCNTCWLVWCALSCVSFLWSGFFKDISSIKDVAMVLDGFHDC